MAYVQYAGGDDGIKDVTSDVLSWSIMERDNNGLVKIGTVNIDTADDNYVTNVLAVKNYVNNLIPTKTSDLTNDSGFITSSYHDSTKQDSLSNIYAYNVIDTTNIQGYSVLDCLQMGCTQFDFKSSNISSSISKQVQFPKNYFSGRQTFEFDIIGDADNNGSIYL